VVVRALPRATVTLTTFPIALPSGAAIGRRICLWVPHPHQWALGPLVQVAFADTKLALAISQDANANIYGSPEMVNSDATFFLGITDSVGALSA
jgi:hypothetical protein